MFGPRFGHENLEVSLRIGGIAQQVPTNRAVALTERKARLMLLPFAALIGERSFLPERWKGIASVVSITAGNMTVPASASKE